MLAVGRQPVSTDVVRPGEHGSAVSICYQLPRASFCSYNLHFFLKLGPPVFITFRSHKT